MATNQKVGGSNPSGLAILPVMYFVYVLRSQKTGKLYVGYTSDPVQRTGQHNHGITKSTKNRGPWDLIHTESYGSRAEAISRERYFKSGKGREELKSILAMSFSSSIG